MKFLGFGKDNEKSDSTPPQQPKHTLRGWKTQGNPGGWNRVGKEIKPNEEDAIDTITRFLDKLF